jgi:hypothetical protein
MTLVTLRGVIGDILGVNKWWMKVDEKREEGRKKKER